MNAISTIHSPDDAALDDLCAALSERAAETDRTGRWPAEQLAWCGRAGVFEWFLASRHGGQGWSDADVIRGYLRLSQACLTTTFIITQRTGACRRIADGDNEPLAVELLPRLLRGESFATVGISHLTTSRRHLGQPALRAAETRDGFRLDGFSPWVTGAVAAEHIVVGATFDDGRQALFALPTDAAGVACDEPAELVALSASATGAVRCDQVDLDRRWLVAGPMENVMSQGVGGNTGGLQTSTLAVGLATAAARFLGDEARRRDDLKRPADTLAAELAALTDDLLAAAADRPVCSTEDLRVRANQLVLRTTQAALTAAKGAGYVAGHPAGRWCREALFFLVWSCPQPVANAALCELAGLGD